MFDDYIRAVSLHNHHNGGVFCEKSETGRANCMPTMRNPADTANVRLPPEPEARNPIETSGSARPISTATCRKAFFRMQ